MTLPIIKVAEDDFPRVAGVVLTKVGGMTSKAVATRVKVVSHRMIVSSLVVAEVVFSRVVEGLVGSIKVETALVALKVEEEVEVEVGALHLQTDSTAMS